MSDDVNDLSQSLALRPRLPPEKSFVSLSHAVSWIALRRSISGPALSKLLGLGEKQCDERIDQNERFDRAIKSAVERLTDLGLGGKIEILGRKYAHVLDDDSDDKIPTLRIPAQRMADYRGFDTLDDTLFLEPYRKVKLAWCQDRKENQSPLGKHFRFVMVNRADLMREFPHTIAPPTGIDTTAKSPPLSDANLGRWWKGLSNAERDLPRDKLHELCVAAHPTNSIARERVRKVAPQQKPGPRPVKPDSAA